MLFLMCRITAASLTTYHASKYFLFLMFFSFVPIYRQIRLLTLHTWFTSNNVDRHIRTTHVEDHFRRVLIVLILLSTSVLFIEISAVSLQKLLVGVNFTNITVACGDSKLPFSPSLQSHSVMTSRVCCGFWLLIWGVKV